MRKGILGDYMKEYHRGNAKGQFTYLFMFIYWMILPIVTGSDKQMMDIHSKWIMGFVCVPMFLSAIAMVFHPICMSKMMYLCPMRAEERKQYVEDMYWFRVMIHCVIAVIFVGIAAGISHCNWLSVILLLLNDFMFAFLIRPKNSISMMVDTDIERWIWFFLHLLICVSNYLQGHILISTDDDLWLNITLAIIFVGIQLPMAWRYRKCVQQRLEEVMMFQE